MAADMQRQGVGIRGTAGEGMGVLSVRGSMPWGSRVLGF